MKAREVEHSITGLMGFALLVMMIIIMLAVVALGVNVYKRVALTAEAVNATRTPLYYVASMIRGAEGEISLEDRSGVSALVISREIDGEKFETLIYGYNGSLYERFASEELGFAPGDGEVIARVDGFSIESVPGGAWRVGVAADGEEYSMTIASRVGR